MASPQPWTKDETRIEFESKARHRRSAAEEGAPATTWSLRSLRLQMPSDEEQQTANSQVPTQSQEAEATAATQAAQPFVQRSRL
ncbi:hypothetical protein G7Y89_g1741 [Cudoniella acicularis]|uniref:Uncharacterized protein n=1 Tax=Cudoniella acicularis TaxID=354080 RepID=A0A8H4RUQ2_9HELO|nr:hypothetical protein G7Y89_g1741 [Cudoniella acicularis]